MDEHKINVEKTASIRNLIHQAAEVLSRGGVPEARREAGSLLAHVLQSDRTHLISYPDEVVEEKKLNAFRSFVERRAGGEPLQYITGFQDFFGLEFRVTPDVLIPRPETELLVEVALDLLRAPAETSATICDVGTGSGCIAISLLHELRSLRGIALDISPAAIEIAGTNAGRHGVGDRLSFLVSDCFSALSDSTPRFDLIASNPPYVAAAALSGLQREVRDHEPHLALSPGKDGLTIIRRLIGEGPRYLYPQGYLLLEIGFDQGNAVNDLVDEKIWRIMDIHPDLQGIPRILALQKIA